jgi:hypothetical protein
MPAALRGPAILKTVTYQVICRDEDVDEVLSTLDFGLETCQCDCLASFDERTAEPQEANQFQDHDAAEAE